MLFRHAVAESVEQGRLKIDVQVAGDGAEAIEYLSGEGSFADRKAHPFPDLIVLDLKMPRMTGLDVLSWLKDHPEYRRIPRILLSGSCEERDIDDAYDLGVNSYFQNPGGLDEFRELIHHMISYWAYTQRPVNRHRAF
jgi:CheY-like chemotaxis protein